MPDLRGVSVWLAARNADIRRPLIEADPVGVAFHGDAESFSREETAFLLSGLEVQLKYQLLTQQWESASSASLGALMAGSGRDMLYDMLRAPDRSEARQYLIARLLRGLGEATMRTARSRVPGSEDARRSAYFVLAATVRDSSWRSDVRDGALVTLIRVLENLPEGPSILLGLLNGLAEGEVTNDEEGRLGFRLLDHLYPQHIGAERIWDYVGHLWDRPASAGSIPIMRWGWLRPWHLADSSAPEDVRTLLKNTRSEKPDAEQDSCAKQSRIRRRASVSPGSGAVWRGNGTPRTVRVVRTGAGGTQLPRLDPFPQRGSGVVVAR